MKLIIVSLSALALVVSCAKAPVKPTDSRGLSSGSPQAADSKVAEDEHADHDDHAAEGAPSEAAAAAAAAGSPRADDIALLQAWTKGQYVGNEQLKLSFLPAVPLQ
jgi:hypothetical protein